MLLSKIWDVFFLNLEFNQSSSFSIMLAVWGSRLHRILSKVNQKLDLEISNVQMIWHAIYTSLVVKYFPFIQPTFCDANAWPLSPARRPELIPLPYCQVQVRHSLWRRYRITKILIDSHTYIAHASQSSVNNGACPPLWSIPNFSFNGWVAARTPGQSQVFAVNKYKRFTRTRHADLPNVAWIHTACVSWSIILVMFTRRTSGV